MQTTTRRELLAACGATVGAFAGCTTLGEADDPNGGDASCPDAPGSDPPTSDVYIAAVFATPDETDDSTPAQETILVETTQQAPADLSGYTLVYCGEQVYEFPELVSNVQPGADIQIYSGPGEDGVDASSPPEYTLHVGSETELLANDGMRLAIRTPEDGVVDAVAYPTLAPGEPYDRPQ